MARRGLVSHHSYEFGIGTQTRVQLAFPRVYQFAENVSVNGDPDRLHRGMMNSRGHRLNRMDPSFTHVGIGVARGTDGRLFLTELFVRVADPSQLELVALYPRVPPEELPHEEALTGQVIDEAVIVPPPTPEDPEYWTHRGIDAYAEGRYAAAVEQFRNALEIDPDYRFARFDLGRALIAAGRPGDALAELDLFLQAHPEDVDAWRSRGSALLLLQDYARAESAFRKVLSQQMTDAGAWYNLGLSLEYQDRPRDAENAYAQALHLDPTLSAAAIGLQRVRR
jgi:Flp pilus assembly protein TadD